jgi:hypothetical protein
VRSRWAQIRVERQIQHLVLDHGRLAMVLALAQLLYGYSLPEVPHRHWDVTNCFAEEHPSVGHSCLEVGSRNAQEDVLNEHTLVVEHSLDALLILHGE